jgi:radical SAM protein with 4Fe4S-binding SPASM domain
MVFCSLNATNKEDYAATVGDGDYDSTVENIRYLISKFKHRVKVNMVVTDYNKNQSELFLKQWGHKGKLTACKNWCGSIPSSLAGNRKSCTMIQRHLTVLWDGRVALCCFDYNGQVILGDLNHQSMKEIWDGNQWMRDKHDRLDFDLPLCRDCNNNVIG